MAQPNVNNDKPCGQCNHYDPIMRGVPSGGHKETARGWCAKRSIYPNKTGPGQVFPSGVKQAANGELPKPLIIKNTEVRTECKYFQTKKQRLTKAELINKATKK